MRRAFQLQQSVPVDMNVPRMPLARRILGAAGSVETLVLIHEYLADQVATLRADVHLGPPSRFAALSADIQAALDERPLVADQMASAPLRQRVVDMIASSGLEIAGWWVLGSCIDAQPAYISDRYNLIRAYLEQRGRGVDDGQYRLTVGDPISASVSHAYRVPVTDWFDRFHHTWFVPETARSISVVVDYRLSAAIDGVTRRSVNRGRLTTVHPFKLSDYRGNTYPADGRFPTVPMPGRSEERRAVLQSSVSQAVAAGASIAAFPELAGDRSDVEAVASQWLDETEGRTLVLAGTFHEAVNGRRMNVALLAYRDGAGGTGKIEFQKNYPMGEWASKKRELVEAATTPELRVLAGMTGSVGVLICRDALHHELVSVISDLSCSIVLVPALSPRAEAFEAAALHLAVHGASQMIFANVAGIKSTTSMITNSAGGRSTPDGGYFIKRSASSSPGICTYEHGRSSESVWENSAS